LKALALNCGTGVGFVTSKPAGPSSRFLFVANDSASTDPATTARRATSASQAARPTRQKSENPYKHE
jgi:hypothetical protein